MNITKGFLRHWTVFALIIFAVLMILIFVFKDDLKTEVGPTDVQAMNLGCPKCNVLLLNLELLRADYVGLIGGSGSTPEIDRFFANGIVFTDVMAPAGETFVSNTSVLTMTDPFTNKIKPAWIDRYKRMDKEEKSKVRTALVQATTVSQILQQNDYHTVNINQGGRAGVQAFLGRGFDDLEQYSSKVLLEDLIDVVLEKIRVVGRPYFLLFRPTLLHNHQYRHPDITAYNDLNEILKFEYSYISPTGTRKTGTLVKRNRKLDMQTGQTQEHEIYRRQLEYGDIQLGHLFSQLDKRDLENTIVVLYSNHGTSLGDNGKFEHGTSFQSNIHVPILISHPNSHESVTVDSTVSLLDLMPSILDMLGIDYPNEDMQRDLFQDLDNGTQNDKMYFGKNNWDKYARAGKWKLIIRHGKYRSLYNLDEDPGEKTDLLGKNQKIARDLELSLLKHELNYRN